MEITEYTETKSAKQKRAALRYLSVPGSMPFVYCHLLVFGAWIKAGWTNED